MAGENIVVTMINGGKAGIVIEELPDTCPICHRAINPKLINGVWNTDQNVVHVVLQCVSRDCQNAFIAHYARKLGTAGTWELKSTEPTRPYPVRIPEEIAKISPDFVTISNQVAAAESQGLDDLVGIGLRKALEFLIKDFAISEHPDKAQAIKKEWLGKCIDLYILDARVQDCAKRATWLGNDQAHYIKKWEHKDVKDLKTLVTLTVNWIHSHLETKRFVGDMPG